VELTGVATVVNATIALPGGTKKIGICARTASARGMPHLTSSGHLKNTDYMRET
jgi:hypothetical protein